MDRDQEFTTPEPGFGEGREYGETREPSDALGASSGEDEGLADEARREAERLGQDVRRHGQELGEEFRHQATEAGGELRQHAEELGSEVSQHAGELGSEVREQAGHMGERGRGALADQAERLSDRLESRARRMEMEGGMKGRAGQWAHRGSDMIEEGAEYVRTHDLGSMADDLSRQVREHPLLSLGVAIGTGYLLGRIFSD